VDFRERNSHWHQLLEYILNSGVDVAIDAVTKNLVAFQILAAAIRGEERPGSSEGYAAIPPDIASRVAELRSAAEQPKGHPEVLRPKKRRTS
jgi:hypothetical protein